MFEQLTRIHSYFEWAIIGSAFFSLILSLYAFLLVIFTRRRVRRAEDMVRQIVEGVNKLSTEAHNASESAARAAAAAEESAKAAKDSAIASKNSSTTAEISAGTINRAAELLTGKLDDNRKMLGE